MNEELILIGSEERLDRFAAGCGGEVLRPDANTLLQNGGALYSEGRTLCAFHGTLYRIDDPTLPSARPEATLIAAYRKYGADFLRCFEGKFILALIDLDRHSVCFARDHFGGMPLYFAFGEDFAAASGRLSALAGSGLVKKELSAAGLCDYFSLRFIPAPNTIYENIHALMAGHMLTAVFSGGRITVEDRCWWDVDCRSEAMLHDYEACKKQLREALLRAVDERCRDGCNGVFLSGGIDSTVVTGVASTLLGRQIDSFTIGFHEEAYDESPRARIASEAHRSRHHLYILDYDESLDELDKVIAGFDQPFADDSAVPTWVINRFAAEEGVRNVLTGDGSDQIFAGSNKYFIRHYVDRLRRIPAPLRALARSAVLALPDNSARMRKIRKVFACVDMDSYEMRRRMLQLCLDDEGLSRLLRGRVVDKGDDAIARLYAQNRGLTDELTNTLYVDLKVVADGGMMTKMGAMSRLAGVDTHMPLMSRELLTLVYHIPPEFKQRGSSGKIILKDAFSDLIPDALKTASKKGFQPPVASWFRGPLLGDLKAALAPERMEAIGLFDPAFVARLIEEHTSMAFDRSVALWALYVFSKWYAREFE